MFIQFPKPERPVRFARTAPARAAMAPASSIQSSENKAKWQFAGSSEVEEQASQQDSASQEPEDAVEVQEKTDEVFWRTSSDFCLG